MGEGVVLPWEEEYYHSVMPRGRGSSVINSDLRKSYEKVMTSDLRKSCGKVITGDLRKQSGGEVCVWE